MGTEGLPKSQRAETNISEVPPCWCHSRVQCGRWIRALPTLFFQPFPSLRTIGWEHIDPVWWRRLVRFLCIWEGMPQERAGVTMQLLRLARGGAWIGRLRPAHTAEWDHIKQHTVEPMRNKNMHRYYQPIKVSGLQDTPWSRPLNSVDLLPRHNASLFISNALLNIASHA